MNELEPMRMVWIYTSCFMNWNSNCLFHISLLDCWIGTKILFMD
jgi:hypothetical protein